VSSLLHFGRRSVWAAVALLLSVASCATPEEPLSATGAAGSHQVPRQSSNSGPGVSSVLTYYLLAGHSFSELSAAWQRAVAACMQDAGWSYYPPPDDVAQSEPTELVALATYRSRFGYGIALGSAQEFNRSTDQNRKYVDSLSTAERSAYFYALNGNSTEANPSDSVGCEAAASKLAYEGIPLFDARYEDLSSQYLARQSSDPRYLAAVSDWATCMRARGFDYATPDLPPSSLSDRYLELLSAGEISPDLNTGGSVSSFAALERDTAVADFECSVDFLYPTKAALQQEYLDELIETGAIPSSFTSIGLP